MCMLLLTDVTRYDKIKFYSKQVGSEQMKEKRIILNGLEVVLDMKDYLNYRHEIQGAYKYWNNKYYVLTKDKKFLHRIIMNVPRGVFVDHINGNSLDNRRCNLRICTNAENQWNTGKKCTSNQPYKGVRKTKSGKYEARIRCKGKRLHLGTFTTVEEAVRVYNAKAFELHGEFAYLNSIDDGMTRYEDGNDET